MNCFRLICVSPVNKVEDQLFRIPRRPLEEQSEFFRELFASKSRSDTKGAINDISEPIFLEGVEKNVFKDLLHLLYPPYAPISFLNVRSRMNIMYFTLQLSILLQLKQSIPPPRPMDQTSTPRKIMELTLHP